MNKNKKIIFTAVLLALEIIIARFLSIKTPILVISFGFLPTMICAYYLGAKWTTIMNVLADLIGALLFPSGAYFVGYTVTAAISGIIYGLLIFNKENKLSKTKIILRSIIAVILVTVICNMTLNTLWISITVGKAFKVLFFSRLIKELIMIPIQILVFIGIQKLIDIPFKKYLVDNDD